MRAATATNHLSHLRILEFFGLIILPLFLVASKAAAEGPMEQLQDTIDGIIK